MRFIVLLLALFISLHTSNAVSCIFNRFGCVPSCWTQNCGTGYCDNGVCRCSRCADGSILRRGRRHLYPFLEDLPVERIAEIRRARAMAEQ